MLILSRRVGETVVIGKEGQIRVTITSVQGASVRLAIAAPRDMPIHREEIFERIQAEQKARCTQ